MKNIFLTLVILLLVNSCFSQNKNDFNTKRPKLIVGIVVDQMRYDYLIKFYDKFSDTGFKKLINSGFNCENVHLNYVPTHTAVGHASIYTGTTPDIHGIVANNWFDKKTNKMIYCVDDADFKTIGGKKGGKKSPNRLNVTTISDQLHLAQLNKGKVIGISLKDRAAILPVGHSANAAYWFRGKKEGNFISSNYYMDELPNWVKTFNKNKIVKTYLNQDWKTLYNIDSYTESIADDNNFEENLKGENDVTFPHEISKIFKEKGSYSLIKKVPLGNTFLVDFAKAAIIGENLGQNKETDFLSISFSSTDYIGHTFGVDSKEVQDTYLRLDLDLANFITFLDTKVGQENYTLFLTADHGALSAHPYLKSLKIPSILFDRSSFEEYVDNLTLKYFNSTNLIENISNLQLFYNKKELERLNLSRKEVSEKLINDIINFEGIDKCISAHTLQSTNFTNGILHYTQNGYNQKISGDLILIPTPNTVFYHEKGSGHSTGYSYDTHIPLIFYGFGINKGNTKKYIPIIDLAPTISSLLKIEFPNGNTGKIIEKVLK